MDPASELHQADALHAARNYADAIAAYRRALEGDATLFEAWYGLGCALLAQQAYGAAADALRRAVAQRTDAAGARCNLAEALFQLGDVDGAIAAYQTAAEAGDSEVRAVALGGIACIAPGGTRQDNARVMAARQRWIEAQPPVQPLAPAPAAASGTSGRKLRIGYLSAFFGARNWMKGYMGVINAHDRTRFEVHLLADGTLPSAESGYADHDDDRIWELGDISNAALATHIAQAGLDVLVDLNGYSYQRRLPLFRYRAAPLQMSWVGMYGTTGLREIDWLVGDDVVIPPAETLYYTERVTRVPGSYLAFWPFYPTPDLMPPPCLVNGHLTFGCLASAYKLTDATVAAHAAVLRAAPGSKLLLRNRTLDEASNRAALLARYAALGIAAERLIVEGGAEHAAFLRSYDRIDVALDAFPYNGGTTTMEALWQGVPMLTWYGDRWAARTSASLLRAAGLDEWVAADVPGFAAAGAALARDAGTPQRLAALRAGMRDRLRASAACDVAGLARALEALYAAPPPQRHATTAG